jgi:hypothetical protein
MLTYLQGEPLTFAKTTPKFNAEKLLDKADTQLAV